MNSMAFHSLLQTPRPCFRTAVGLSRRGVALWVDAPTVSSEGGPWGCPWRSNFDSFQTLAGGGQVVSEDSSQVCLTPRYRA